METALSETVAECVPNEDWIIVLFYQYCNLESPSSICEAQLLLCRNLNLLGRVRVSPEGINGTLGGSSSSIHQYIAVVDKIPEFESVSKPIHWKLSGLSQANMSSNCDHKLKTLSVKIVKEVVSLDLSKTATLDMIKAGPGKHLTPQEFHDALTASIERKKNKSNKGDATRALSQREGGQNDGAGNGTDSPPSADADENETNVKGTRDISVTANYDGDIVLLDVRNYYETRIGRFLLTDDDGQVISSAIDPQTRQFSDFAKFVDTNIENYKEKKVLMYCTGGVRCERASAYLRSKGVDDVSQLSGGIHAYQEKFPLGGYFHGKNFVFDPRIAVPSADNCDEIIGKCSECVKPFDDYTRQCRCSTCRVLVLVCNDCFEFSKGTEEAELKSFSCDQCSGRYVEN